MARLARCLHDPGNDQLSYLESLLLYSARHKTKQEAPMSGITLYHNPRCSKSRATLALLEEHGFQPTIVLYLDTTPDKTEISELLQKLQLSASELVRKGEDAYKACGLSAASSQEEIVAAMAAHPKLIERPIVVKGNKAVLGRPPENVLELIG